MSVTNKPLSTLDASQVLQGAQTPEDNGLLVNGFLVGKLGRKIVRTAFSATVDDFQFMEDSVVLYTIRVTYNNAAHDDIDIAERIV